MLDKLINQLIKELSMEEFVTSPENQHYILPFEENLEVEAIELDHYFVLKGKISPSPETNVEAFFLKVMEANLFGIGTRGAAIGLNEDGKLLTLSQQLDYNTPFKEFKEKLEDFVSVMDFWRKEALKHE